MTPLSTVNCFEDYHLGPSSSNMVFETELDHALSQIHKGPRTNMDKQDLRVSLSFLSQPFPTIPKLLRSISQRPPTHFGRTSNGRPSYHREPSDWPNGSDLLSNSMEAFWGSPSQRMAKSISRETKMSWQKRHPKKTCNGKRLCIMANIIDIFHHFQHNHHNRHN